MADNTPIGTATGGDSIRTDAVTYDDGTIAKTQIVKVGLGGDGVDAGPVEAHNPFPVYDPVTHAAVLEVRDLLRELLSALQPRRG